MSRARCLCGAPWFQGRCVRTARKDHKACLFIRDQRRRRQSWALCLVDPQGRLIPELVFALRRAYSRSLVTHGPPCDKEPPNHCIGESHNVI